MERKVTVIPATVNPLTRVPSMEIKKRKAAGYARVSTAKDEQYTSYEAQVDYYTRFIWQHSDWSFVKVYTDEGISGLDTKKRDGFNEMIADALSGQIDLIITKSVSRFARNTVDSLTTIRKLKNKGVEVYFEKENIWTFDGKGELLLTIMSSLAQEESRSISENVTWGQRKRFSDGKISLPYKSFLGYAKGADGLPVIVPEEAEVVKDIYRLFIQGKTANWIANHLTEQGVPTPRKRDVWQGATVRSILTNEKYKGCAVLQKTFTVDFLSKKMKVNEGEVPQYIVNQSHPAIIDPEEWQKVQDEIEVRKARGNHHNSLSPFSSIIVCGDCGSFFGSKIWHSTDKYRHVVWQCNNKFKGDKRCRTPHLCEEDIQRLFLAAVSTLTQEREAVLETCALIRDRFLDTAKIDNACSKLAEDMNDISALTKSLIAENATTALPQDEFKKKYEALVKRYQSAESRLKNLQKQKTTRRFQADVIERFMVEIQDFNSALPLEFSDRLWSCLIDKVTVYHDGRLVFRFKNGAEVEERL